MNFGLAESDHAKRIVEYLMKMGWDVYQEVRAGHLCPRADIVAIQQLGKAKLSWIIETKTSFSISVIEQALYWRDNHSSNYVSISPAKIGNKVHRMIRLLNNYGIGVFMSNPVLPKYYRINRHFSIERYLHEEQKNYLTAGSPGGGYYTQFRETKNNIENYVKNNPGCTLKEAIDNTKHHYTSDKIAIARIYHWMRCNVNKTIGLQRSGKTFKLFYKEQ